MFLTARGQIKILDFGPAKALDASSAAADATRAADGLLTGAGAAVGTMGYMSPEQLRGETIDARSDLFALGVVLYEMATGQRAFQGSTGAAVSHAILGEHPVAPRTIRADLPVKLEEAILKALEKDRDVRCQTAAELRADLKRVKRDLPVVSDRTRRASRHPAPFASMPGGVDRAGSTHDARRAPASSDTQLVVGLVQRHRLAVLLSIVGVAGAIAAGVWFTNHGTPASTPASLTTALQIQPLTFTGNTGARALSPDGKFVAYLRREGRDNAHFALWVRQLTTQSDVQIVPVVPGRRFVGLVVTPDGYVDFVAVERGGRSRISGACRFWAARHGVSLPASGRPPRGRPMAGTWHSSGRRMTASKRRWWWPTRTAPTSASWSRAAARSVFTAPSSVRKSSPGPPGRRTAGRSWCMGSSRQPGESRRHAELVVIDVATGTETRTVPSEQIDMMDAAWTR